MPIDWPAVVLVLGTTVIIFHSLRGHPSSRDSHPLPPGPRGLPWVGNVIGVDSRAPWKTYAKWAKTYGDIVHSRLFGKDVIIINSERIARDLLEKRSANYSDRPSLIAQKMLGQDFMTGMLPYGDLWRLHRLFFHQTYRPQAIPRFLPLQHRKSCHFLRRLFDEPERLDNHVFEYIASLVLNSVYDYDPQPGEDKLIGIIGNLLEIVVPAARPDLAIIIEAFPFLRYLPSWLPGMSFKKQFETIRAYTKVYLEWPFAYALQRVASGGDAPSMVGDGLQHLENAGNQSEKSGMDALMKSAATGFVAGTETTNSFLMTFFLVMMLNPAAQEKAQVQIDEVVGESRLPSIEDRPLLPFVDAIIQETLRYNIVAPLSLPRIASNDDVYEGYRIPKGAIILANSWLMARDESKYPNPDAFVPERFLNDDGSLKPNDTENIAFGFGRHICAGRFFAETSVWGLMARVLALFKILKPLDEKGDEVTIEPRFSSGLVVHPLPFKCRIVPRFAGMDSEKLEELINASTG